jgi:hypothetical protein
VVTPLAQHQAEHQNEAAAKLFVLVCIRHEHHGAISPRAHHERMVEARTAVAAHFLIRDSDGVLVVLTGVEREFCALAGRSE